MSDNVNHERKRSNAMSVTKVYGASDDLIEVEGGFNDEFSWFSDKPVYLNFSDGTQLSALYDKDGIWRLDRTREGTNEFRHEPGSVDDDRNDVVFLTGEVKWVEKWAHASPTKDDIEEWFERWCEDDCRDSTLEQMKQIYSVVTGRTLL